MEGLNRREGPQYLEIFFKDLELSYSCKRTLFLKAFKNLLSKLVKALILHLTFVKKFYTVIKGRNIYSSVHAVKRKEKRSSFNILISSNRLSC